MAYSYVWNIKQQWLQQQANTWSRGDRGLFLGGQSPTASNVIDFINISSVGNATDFGDLANAGLGVVASNSIRASRLNGSNNSIDYITMSTLGNAADFGDRLTIVYDTSAANETRGLYAGGYAVPNFSPGWNNPTIEFLTFSSLGNCTDFGDLTQGRSNQTSGANPTRAIFAGGFNGSPGNTNVADYVTIATAGNALDFGDLVGTTWAALPANSNIRLFCAGGQPASNVISYFTFSTLGNSVDWGDLSVKGAQGSGSSNNVRGIFGMGEAASPIGVASNALQYVSLASAGNSADFGDLTVGRQDNYGIAAQGHGGISIGEPRIGDTVLGTQVYFSGDRGIFATSITPAPASRNQIEYISIASTGNAVDFGDATNNLTYPGAAGNQTRALFGPSERSAPVGYSALVDYIQFSTKGNAANFGSLTVNRSQASGVSNSTRALFGGGFAETPGNTWYNVIDFVTISTLGNGVDFGDLNNSVAIPAAAGSSTRALFAGGGTPSSPSGINVIDFVTIATTGNATDFGDLITTIQAAAGSSSSTRALFGGGLSPTITNTIAYVTIASAGNAIDFGDLTQARNQFGATSNGTRGVFAGGQTPTIVNTIDYVTIASIGNATDFGDLVIASYGGAGTSSGHGGLQ
jgi:hypothetical protein